MGVAGGPDAGNGSKLLLPASPLSPVAGTWSVPDLVKRGVRRPGLMHDVGLVPTQPKDSLPPAPLAAGAGQRGSKCAEHARALHRKPEHEERVVVPCRCTCRRTGDVLGRSLHIALRRSAPPPESRGDSCCAETGSRGRGPQSSPSGPGVPAGPPTRATCASGPTATRVASDHAPRRVNGEFPTRANGPQEEAGSRRPPGYPADQNRNGRGPEQALPTESQGR